MHLSVEKCLEYKANNGTVILIDKEEYKLGDYFLKNQIFILKKRLVDISEARLISC